MIREGGSKSEPCDDSEREHSRSKVQDWTQPSRGHRRSPRLRDGGRGEGADLVGTLALTTCDIEAREEI